MEPGSHNEYLWDMRVHYHVSALGDYKAQVEIRDAEDETKTTLVNVTIHIRSMMKVSGTLTSENGIVIPDGRILFRSGSNEYYVAESDENGHYDILFEPLSKEFEVTPYLLDSPGETKKIITGKENQTLNLVVDEVFRINVKSTDYDLSTLVGTWHAGYYGYVEGLSVSDYVGKGTSFILPKGSSTVHFYGTIETNGEKHYCNIDADVQATSDAEIELQEENFWIREVVDD